GVRDVQPQPPLGIGFDNIAQLPADGMRRDRALQPPDPKPRNDVLKQTPKDAADAYIDLEHAKSVMLVLPADVESDVIHTHKFASVDVDNLLIEKIPGDAQHVLVIMVRREELVVQADALERNGLHLIVANGEPCRARADQKAIDAKGIDHRENG